MKQVGVVVFPGSHSAPAMRAALDRIPEVAVSELWHGEENLPAVDVLIVPGGAAYGDLIRPGALAKSSPAAAAIRKFNVEGGRILGFGNGFQILCEIGVLPGVLLLNRSAKFLNEAGFHRVEERLSNEKFPALDASKVYSWPLACRYGRYYADRRTLADMEESGQIAVRYCDQFGEIDTEQGFNGCALSIAGVVNKAKNAFGLMARPERAFGGRGRPADSDALLSALLN